MSFQPVPAEDYLPQKAPFAMVDELLYVDDKTTQARLRIREDNVMAPAGFFSSGGMVEAMAQTAAAGTGFLHRQKGQDVPVGYIGAIQNLVVTGWPSWNDLIRMEVKQVTQVLQVSLVSGEVWLKNEMIARCDMKIFITHPAAKA